MKLLEAHKISDMIELKISNINKDYERIITMHLDPFDDSN
jgi:divalent metal cation (Fe/Co/Zn/Cd) transporter